MKRVECLILLLQTRSFCHISGEGGRATLEKVCRVIRPIDRRTTERELGA